MRRGEAAGRRPGKALAVADSRPGASSGEACMKEFND